MKKIVFWSIQVCISTFFILFFTSSIIFAEAINIDPIDDVSVHESEPDKNFNLDGGADRDAMTVKRNKNDNVESYYKFDLSHLDETISSVTLKVYGRVTSGENEVVKAYSVNDDNWEETEITWNDRLEVGDVIGETEIGMGNDYWSFDVTEYVKERLVDNE